MQPDILKSLLSQATQVIPGVPVLIILLAILSLKSNKLIKYTILAAVSLLVFSSPFFKNILVSSIENNHEQIITAPSDITHILLLSAGHRGAANTPQISQLNPTSLTRLVEAVRLWRQIPHAQLIVTGNKGHNSHNLTQAQVSKSAAVWMGVNSENIIMIPHANNTEQETAAAANLVGDGKLMVVTSAIHLPRALSFFKNTDIETVGAPTHFMSNTKTPWWKFGAQYILHVDRAMHEIVGELWLQIRPHPSKE